jgi:Asp-tRNA(Asn)/Glu-tRNA(Gln) amidotransferase A subunit family amidase
MIRRSVNSAYGARSLPIGLQIIGRRFDDPAVPAIARAFEAMRPQFDPASLSVIVGPQESA